MTALTAVFPLSQAFLPGESISLRIFEPRYVQMIRDIQLEPLELCTVLIERGAEVGGGDVRLSHGVFLNVEQIVEHDGLWLLECRANRVVSIVQWDTSRPYPTALINDQRVQPASQDEVETVASQLEGCIQNIRDLVASIAFPEEPRQQATDVCDRLLAGVRDSSRAPDQQRALWQSFWLAARLIPCGSLDRYSLLEPGALLERVVRLKGIIEHVSEVARFEGHS